MITPLLGGTPAVWNTCMVFFQAVLLAGYAYAHFSTSWLGARNRRPCIWFCCCCRFWFCRCMSIRISSRTCENPVYSLLLLLTHDSRPAHVRRSAPAPLCYRNGSPALRIRPRPIRTSFTAPAISAVCLLCWPIPLWWIRSRLGQQRFDWTVVMGFWSALTAAVRRLPVAVASQCGNERDGRGEVR